MSVGRSFGLNGEPLAVLCASGPNVSVRLTFDLIVDDSDDGEPTLLNDGGPITIADAARLILDPFLFPELPEFTPDYD